MTLCVVPSGFGGWLVPCLALVLCSPFSPHAVVWPTEYLALGLIPPPPLLSGFRIAPSQYPHIFHLGQATDVRATSTSAAGIPGPWGVCRGLKVSILAQGPRAGEDDPIGFWNMLWPCSAPLRCWLCRGGTTGHSPSLSHNASRTAIGHSPW